MNFDFYTLIVFSLPCALVAFAIFRGISGGIAKLFSPKEHYELLTKDLKRQYSEKENELKKRYDELEFEVRQEYNGLCIQKIKEFRLREKQLDEKYKELDNELKNKYSAMFNTLKKDRNLLESLLADKKQSNPAMAKVFADYEWYIANRMALQLESKKHPAKKASSDVRDYGRRNRVLQQRNKELEYLQSFWEYLFPWLIEFKEVQTDEVAFDNYDIEHNSDYDRAKLWLSQDEYDNLSNTEKYQLALDRYRNRKNKSKWDIGVEYERYIGYLYEQAGYKVEYRGALDGLQDMGRDLIISKDNSRYVVQCKYWNTNKTIHEKHIFQLFGSMTLLKLQDSTNDVFGIFITSTKLSDVASQVAEMLNIQVRENVPMSHEYPCIKCNVNKTTKEKIYHLPFDQQYDNCVIKKELGEFFAMTVKDAEDKGFRRALHWQGNKPKSPTALNSI